MDTEYLILYIIPLVILIPSLWMVFQKAGQPGWASIIPVFNIYVSLKVAGRSGWWTIPFYIPWVDLFVMALLASGMAKRFGKSPAFAFGLFFLNIIFLPILAFGKAEYSGNVVLFGKEEEPPLKGSKRAKPDTMGYYCAECGNDVEDDWAICANCGAKLAY